MKNIQIFSWMAASALAFGLVSCDDELTGPQIDLDAVVVPALTVSNTATSIEIKEEDADKPFMTFSWTEPDFGATLPLEYTLQYDTTQSGAPKAYMDLVTTTDLSKTYITKDINTYFYNKKFPTDKFWKVNFRVKTVVKSASGNASIDPVYSDVKSMSLKVYSILPKPNYTTVGIIGDATPGGWDSDTDMKNPSPLEVTTWKVTLYLIGGKEAKFRANDSWDVNWGANTFPNGVGTSGGPNIPIATSGVYEVTFNDETGAYSFKPAPSIGLIGSATSTGWDSDGDLETEDYITFSSIVYLKTGEVKFRLNNSWDTNWGGPGLSGTGVAGGANIAIAETGHYKVTFNYSTAEYSIEKQADKAAYTTVGIIGSATPGGWDADTDMVQDSWDPHYWTLTLDLTVNEAKFRAENAWSVNWGANTFPKGTATQDGPNIPVNVAGTYKVTFSSYTGKYTFTLQ